MKRLISTLFILALVAVTLPSVAFATEGEITRYVMAVQDAHERVTNPESALGAPDMRYASTDVYDASLTLDVGEGREALGNISLFYRVTTFVANISIEFIDAGNTVRHTVSQLVPPGTVWEIEYPVETPYKFIRITNKSIERIDVDALRVAQIIESPTLPEEEATPIIEEVVEEESYTTTPPRGTLVKLADDWNDDTNNDKVIYVLDADNNRHMIPNETVFKSWGFSFDDVTVVGEGTLSGMDLLSPAYIRPGSYLVKIQVSSQVYAVEPGGIIRWIETEEVASRLYGDSWANRVVDVPETLFSQYTYGTPIREAVYPAGSFVKDTSGVMFYIGVDGLRFSLNQRLSEAYNISSEFASSGLSIPELAERHEGAGSFRWTESLRWPY